MGNFLDTPVTRKETEVGVEPQKELSYGLSAMQGWRAQMEDDHIQLLSLPELPDLSLFAVFDGHGGDMVAQYAAKNFPQQLLRTLRSTNLTPDLADFETKSKQALELALMGIDAELRTLQEVESGQDQSGSTSVMILLAPKHIVCANTGDSRAVLSRNQVAVALSFDHKPYNPEEKERIENAGAAVKFNRVNGDLAVSRALGDFVYKRCESMPPEKQAVTAFPQIIQHERHPEDEFIVIACDGIWDVMSSEEVVAKVHDLLANGRPHVEAPNDHMATESAENKEATNQRPWDLGAVCESLIDHCLQLGSRDNMSVIIVLLQPTLQPKTD